LKIPNFDKIKRKSIVGIGADKLFQSLVSTIPSEMIDGQMLDQKLTAKKLSDNFNTTQPYNRHDL
jgi:hypothetical protein